MPVKGRYDKLPNNQEEPSREKPGLMSLLSFHWITETFKTGNCRPLEKSDLLPNDEENKTKALTEKLQTLWHDEKEMRQKCGKKPRLWICVCKLLPFIEIFTILILNMADIICRILRALLLGIILSNLTSQNQDKTIMYACAALLGVTSMGRSLATHLRRWVAEGHGAKLCCALKGIMYAKVILLGHRTLQEFQEGHVIDLLSNDIQRIELAPRWFFDMIWFIFFTPVILYLFLNLFDWEALVGILVLLSLVPYFFFVSFVVGKLRRQTAELSDKRIALMNELVSGIRVVKTQAWEQNYEEKVKRIRRQEISKIRERSLAISTTEAIVFCTASVAAFVAVLCLLKSDLQVTPANAFMLLAFMNLSRDTFSVFLGKGFQSVFEAAVSLERIEEFLVLEELPSLKSDFQVSNNFAENGSMLESDAKTSKILLEEEAKQFEANKNESELTTKFETKNRELHSYYSEEALVVSNLSYKLIEGEDKYILEDISFVTPRNTLTAICGQVGSGKSTLLCAIAGQIKLSSGTVQYPRPLVYVPQVPWLFSGTIKENILFGAPYNPEWYSTVVEACLLKEDIELFPDTDETVIGQKGVVLSGGQKARVSLARAVYSCAEVYVLDDPLSAVDQKVGDQIFEKCICGLLDDKITVLVSHHSRYLQKADQIVFLDNGRVKEILTPKLSKTKGADDVLSNSTIGEFEDKKGSLLCKSSPDKSQGLEIPEEDRVVGNLSFRLYWDYFRSGMHPVLVIGFIVLILFIQPAVIFPDIWLSYLSKKTLKQQQKFDNLVIYSSGIAVSAVLAILRVALFFLLALRASQRLHDRMVKAVLHAKLLFFDTNPTGRILNRFSRDIGCIDEQLPQFSILCIQYVLFVLSGALIPAFASPWLLLVLFPILLVSGLFTRYYLKTSRELKRLESICRSPVFSHFSETMDGLDTIRTRRMEEEFVEEFYRHQDVHNQAFIMVFESTHWFGLRVDTLCVIFLTCVAFASVGLAMDPAIAGLSLTYVMESLGTAQFATRYFSEVENFMTSVERVMTYTNLEPEPGYKTKALPPSNWPRDGHVTFRDVTMTYHEGGPQVLKEMSFTIKGKSRIGVVGRTGAGKSSVVAALLRMPDAQGDVIIDGIRINDINLQASRRCISVLGQIPTLFSGSLRRNIDPMDQHEDASLWAALEDVQLKSFVKGLSGQLDYELLERGANLSVGERQLICLARTLMENNIIVILDEPTAHVDPITEQTIWKTVHEKLKNCTMITIAHRLDTIKDCDMVLVVKDGKVAEFGTFDSLVGKEGGVLADIVQTAKDS